MRYSTYVQLGAITLACASLVICVYFFRQRIAVLVWREWHTPLIALLAPPLAPKDNFEIGMYYFSTPHYDLARAHFYLNRAAAAQADYPEVNLELARIDFINAHFREAIAYVGAEIKEHPENPTSYYLRGLIYGYIDDSQLAEADFLKFLSLVPESWAGHNDLAFVYFQEGKYKEAAAIAEDGLRYSVGNPWLHNSLGVAQLNLGDKTDALGNFRLAKAEFENMTPGQWGNAYPGNDPQLYAGGLKSILASIDQNIALLQATSTMHS